MQVLSALKQNIYVIAFVIGYVIINSFLTYNKIYLLNLLPLLLIFLYLTFARIDLVYFIIIICTPLSIPLVEFYPSSKIDFAIPTEPLLFGLMLIIFYRWIYAGNLKKSRIFTHPVTYAIILYLFWIFITSITSTIYPFSFKFLLARIWFITVFYFLASYIFRKTQNIKTFILCYAVPMLIVIIYSVSRNLTYGLFDKQMAYGAMNPFFKDHTSYGAALAMLFFALLGLFLSIKKNVLLRTVVLILWLLSTFALILSYTRAAWVSVIIALLILVSIKLRLKFRFFLLMVAILSAYIIFHRTAIWQKFEKNRQVSSTAITEHIKSISNVTTDESNLERINRWKSALRMTKERPFLGWGANTYMYKYAPYQRSREKTSISTDFGELGNVHSEYIGPLVETGIPGALLFIFICVFTLITGFNVYRKITDIGLKQLILFLILGYITYLVHGIMNNFLDTDKISSLFWGFTAIFVSLDISLKKLDAQH